VHWRQKVLGDPSCEVRTVVVGEAVAGYVARFERDGTRMISYWLGREIWGRGIATAAVTQFLATVDLRRPIHADVARSNLPSRRVLEKCGFHVGEQPLGATDASEVRLELTVLNSR
jgi:RimJ/RimL family protein N-acetyltransferase